MEEEPFIKETERGREVYCELHRQIEKYNRGTYGFGRQHQWLKCLLLIYQKMIFIC